MKRKHEFETKFVEATIYLFVTSQTIFLSSVIHTANKSPELNTRLIAVRHENVIIF